MESVFVPQSHAPGAEGEVDFADSSSTSVLRSCSMGSMPDWAGLGADSEVLAGSSTGEAGRCQLPSENVTVIDLTPARHF